MPFDFSCHAYYNTKYILSNFIAIFLKLVSLTFAVIAYLTALTIIFVLTKSLKYSLLHYHAMDYGDHGKRGETGFSIIMDIMNGHNTSEEIKSIYTRRKGKKSISSKAVDYHLRRLVKEGLIVKSSNRFYINYRSSKAIRRILMAMRDFRPDELGFREGFYSLMGIWASITGFGIKDAILSPESIQEHFWKYTAEFMAVPRNLKDFYVVWGFVDNLSVERLAVKKEMEKRFRAHFNPKKHAFNHEYFAKLPYEIPELVKELAHTFNKSMKELDDRHEA